VRVVGAGAGDDVRADDLRELEAAGLDLALRLDIADVAADGVDEHAGRAPRLAVDPLLRAVGLGGPQGAVADLADVLHAGVGRRLDGAERGLLDLPDVAGAGLDRVDGHQAVTSSSGSVCVTATHFNSDASDWGASLLSDIGMRRGREGVVFSAPGAYIPALCAISSRRVRGPGEGSAGTSSTFARCITPNSHSCLLLSRSLRSRRMQG
jgi:hypothetical protein